MPKPCCVASYSDSTVSAPFFFQETVAALEIFFQTGEEKKKETLKRILQINYANRKHKSNLIY